QCRQRLIEHPGVAILKLLEVTVVHVPAAVARVFDRLDMRTPIHLYESHTRLDQPPGHQAALAEAEFAVFQAQRVRLWVKIENLPRSRGSKQRESLLSKSIEPFDLRRVV